MIKVITLLFCLCLLAGCNNVYVIGQGYSSTTNGLLYANTTRGGIILPKTDNLDDIVILGDVIGKSSMVNILGLVSAGDAGINTAKKDALEKYPQADDIINIEVDNQHISILSLYSHSETILRGKAIKYKKGLPDTAQ